MAQLPSSNALYTLAPFQGLSWPILLPVHDALRDAYWGTVLPGGPATASGGASADAFLNARTARLSTDSVHISTTPPALLSMKAR